MIVPEHILHKFIKGCLDLIKEDFKNNQEEDTILYSLFKNDDNGNEIFLDNDEWYLRAKSLFIDLYDNETPRQLDVFVGYNLNRLNFPSIHLLLPSESTGELDSLGFGLDYVQKNGKRYLRKSRSYSCTYNMMITSENSVEVILMYNYLKAIVIMYHETLELRGLRNLKFSGQDVHFNNELVPPSIFHRNLGLQFSYESHVDIPIIENKINGIKVSLNSDCAI